MKTKKTIIIGLDGLSPKLLNILIDRGFFKTVNQLKSTGTYSTLKSTHPPLTAPAWTSFATGVKPGKHGLYDFFKFKQSINQTEPVTSQDIKLPTFYQLLDNRGQNCLLINLPISWPPLTNQPIITSLLTQTDSAVYPKSLIKTFPELKNYQITPQELKNNRAYFKQISSLEKKRFQIAHKLISHFDWNLTFILFSGIDWISHRSYHQLINGSIDPVLKQYFKNLDHYVKTFADLKPQPNLIILSDHGFRQAQHQLNLNQWLVSQKLAIRQASTRQKSLTSILNQPLAAKIITKIYQTFNRLAGLTIDINETLDAKHSQALATGAGIFINSPPLFKNGSVPKSQKLKLAKNIQTKLKSLKDPNTKQLIFKQVLLKRQAYHGPHLNLAPDIILVPKDDWRLNHFLSYRELIRRQSINDHHQTGILILNGPSFKNSLKLNQPHLADITPTILKLHQVPLPHHLDGRSLIKNSPQPKP